MLDLLFDQQVVDTRPLTLAPGETSPQVFSATQERDGIFTVRIDAKDDLAADNQASIVSLLPQPVRVLLVTHGNRFMEKALRAASDVDLTVATDTLDGAPNSDVVVLDDVTPDRRGPKTACWHFTSPAPICLKTAGRTSIRPAIVDWKNTHPLLRYINLDNIQISERSACRRPRGACRWWSRGRRR